MRSMAEYRDDAARLIRDRPRRSYSDPYDQLADAADFGAVVEVLARSAMRGDSFRARVRELMLEAGRAGSESRNPHDPVYQAALRQASDEEYRSAERSA